MPTLRERELALWQQSAITYTREKEQLLQRGLIRNNGINLRGGEFSLNIRSYFILLHFSAHGTVSKRGNLVTLGTQMCTELEASEGTLPGSAVMEQDMKRMGPSSWCIRVNCPASLCPLLLGKGDRGYG